MLFLTVVIIDIPEIDVYSDINISVTANLPPRGETEIRISFVETRHLPHSRLYPPTIYTLSFCQDLSP